MSLELERIDRLPPKTAKLMRSTLARYQRLAVFYLLLFVGGLAFLIGVMGRPGLLFAPLLLVFPVLAVQVARSRGAVHRVIHALVEEPRKVTAAQMTTYWMPRAGRQRTLELRLADGTRVRLVHYLHDEVLFAAHAEINTLLGRRLEKTHSGARAGKQGRVRRRKR